MFKFWGRREVAEYLGVLPDSLNGYDLPEEDALIGRHRGWLPKTIMEWAAQRPGKGNWSKSTARSARARARATDA